MLKARGLAALGHEIHVITRSSSGHGGQRRDADVHLTLLPAPDAVFGPRTKVAEWLAHSALVAGAVQRLHAGAPLDIVDFPEWASEGFVHLLNRAPRSKVATVVQLHGPLVMFAHALGWPEIDSEMYRTGRFMEGTCLRLADAVYSSSDCSTDWCVRHHGLRRSDVPTLHLGVDVELFQPGIAAKDGHPTIIFVGKIIKGKGIEDLVEAACALACQHPNLRLRLVGRADERLLDQIRTRTADWPELLCVEGHLDQERLPAYLGRSHVFAAPSPYEGGPGYVYLEAMACGLPVVACSGSGAAEVVRHGENGLLVRPGDLGSLVDALRALLGDQDVRDAMGRRGRRDVVASADARVCVRRLEGFYSEVTGN